MKIRTVIVLIAFLWLATFEPKNAFSKTAPAPEEIRTVYLGTPNIFNQKKIAELEKIITDSSGSPRGCNGIVIDFKDSNDLPQDYMAALVTRFKKHNTYVIARIVTFQDSRFAKKHPKIAVRKSSGDFWYDGGYWIDPASELVQNYNILIAKQAINCGFDEIQFDYVRFPTGKNMKDMRFPVFSPSHQSKPEAMKSFFQKIKKELKTYAPEIPIGIDLFGEVFVYGKETGIGQNLKDASEYFNVLCPMAYPSHYMCREFGVRDPTAHPYKVYHITLENGLKFLDGKKIVIRPWIQDFTWPSIYNCGPKVVYTKEKVLDQIQAGRDLGVNGFMLWNASNNFTISVFK